MEAAWASGHYGVLCDLARALARRVAVRNVQGGIGLDRSALILTASDPVGRSSAGVAMFGCGVLNYASSPRDCRLLQGGDTPKQRKL